MTLRYSYPVAVKRAYVARIRLKVPYPACTLQSVCVFTAMDRETNIPGAMA